MCRRGWQGAVCRPQCDPDSLHQQMLRMEAQMILNKGRDEVVAVVIARLHAQRQREPHLFCHHIQPLRLKLIRWELIAVALIDQDLQALLHLTH